MADHTLPAKPSADRLDATTGGDVAVLAGIPAAPLRADPRFADAVRKVEDRIAGRKF